MQTGAATVENSMEFPQKTKYRTAIWPGNSTAGNTSYEPWNTNSDKGLITKIYKTYTTEHQEDKQSN